MDIKEFEGENFGDLPIIFQIHQCFPLYLSLSTVVFNSRDQ